MLPAGQMKLSKPSKAVSLVVTALWLFNTLLEGNRVFASECTSPQEWNGEDVCLLGHYLTNNLCCECNVRTNSQTNDIVKD